MSNLGASLVLVSTRLEVTRQGTNTVEVWEGTRAGAETAVGSLAAYQDWSYEETNPPLVRLTVRTPDALTGDSSETFRWEMPGQEVERDLFEHPLALFLSPGQVLAIRQWIKDPPTAEEDELLPDAVKFEDGRHMLGIATAEIATSIYALLKRGTEAYWDAQYSLKLTRTVGSRYAVDAADIAPLSIYQIGDIVAEANINNTPMPSRMQYKAERIPEQYPLGTVLQNTKFFREGGPWIWGWLKKPSSETQLTRGKIEITTEWVLGMISNFLYPIYGRGFLTT